MKYIKEITLSLGAASLFGGCAATNIPVDNDKFDYKKVNNKKYQEAPAIQEIETPNYFSKVESLEQNIPEMNIKVYFSNKTLNDVLKMLPLEFNLAKEYRNIKIDKISHNGDLKVLLDTLSEKSGLYWTYKNGVLSFDRTKVVIYKFPIFSAEKLNLIFNITDDSNDKFNVSSIKADVFDEIKDSLTAITTEYNVEASYEEVLEKLNNNSNKKENTLLNNEKIQNLESLMKEIKKENNDNVNSKEVSRDSKNDTTLETSGVNNGFVRNNKQDTKPAAGAQAAQTPTNMLLEYDIKKESKKTGNNETTKVGSKENTNDSSNINKNSNIDNNMAKNEKAKENQLNNTNTNENTENVRIVNTYKKVINPNKIDVSVLKESGMVIVNVNKDFEKKVDSVLESITNNIMSNMVVMDLYVIEANKTRLKEFKSELSVTRNSKNSATKLDFGSSGLTFSKDTLADTLNALNVNGIDSLISGLINYTTEDSKSKVLTNPKILSIPNIPARIKSSTAYPYLNVQSLGGTEEGPEMSIEFINEGTDIALLSNVYNDDIFLSLGVKLNKYVGDKTVQAGTLGAYDIPIQSPRTLNTTFRMKAGEIAILGGMDSIEHSNKDNYNTFLPTGVGGELKETELIIIAAPRLIRYIKPKTAN